MVSSVFVIFDRSSLTLCCFNLHAGAVFPDICQKNAKCGTCWSICQNWLSNCLFFFWRILLDDQFCKYCESLNVCWRCWVCRILDLDFRNCNLLKGGPPSTLLSSVKFVIFQNTCKYLQYWKYLQIENIVQNKWKVFYNTLVILLGSGSLEILWYHMK